MPSISLLYILQSLFFFSGTHENPELIWNDEARERVARTVRELMEKLYEVQRKDPCATWSVSDVKFTALQCQSILYFFSFQLTMTPFTEMFREKSSLAEFFFVFLSPIPDGSFGSPKSFLSRSWIACWKSLTLPTLT